MQPEITLAAARMDLRGIGYNDIPDLTELRKLYPDLDFVFDKLEDGEEAFQDEEDDHKSTNQTLCALEVKAAELQELMAKICKLSKDSENATELTLRVVRDRIHMWAEAGCDINLNAD